VDKTFAVQPKAHKKNKTLSEIFRTLLSGNPASQACLTSILNQDQFYNGQKLSNDIQQDLLDSLLSQFYQWTS
jgi:hypothetical protein